MAKTIGPLKRIALYCVLSDEETQFHRYIFKNANCNVQK